MPSLKATLSSSDRHGQAQSAERLKNNSGVSLLQRNSVQPDQAPLILQVQPKSIKAKVLKLNQIISKHDLLNKKRQ